MDKNERRIKKVLSTSYFRWGLTILCVGVVLILFYRLIANFHGFRTGIGKISAIISPFIYGFVMAYLLGPIYNYIIKKFYPLLKGKTKKNTTALKISKVISTVICLLVLFGVVTGITALIVPQLIESIRILSQTLPGRMDQVNEWTQNIFSNMGNQEIAETLSNGYEEIQGTLLEWVQHTLLPGVGSLMQRVSSSVILTIRTIFNVVIGVIVCVYFLNGKETFRAQYKKIVNAFLSKKHAEELFDFTAFTNHTFGGFITGKIIDSLIIGLICFVSMTLLRLPYPVLISTIIGITNIIPFFGPFIGAIPSLFIIVIVNPIQALVFLVLIVVLQQVDGNIIGPRILGSSIGIASFWVMFAIIVGGGLFGFLGMVLGVPIFAVIYYYIGKYLERRLEKEHEPEWTRDYMTFDKYDIPREDILSEIEGWTPEEEKGFVKKDLETNESD